MPITPEMDNEIAIAKERGEMLGNYIEEQAFSYGVPDEIITSIKDRIACEILEQRKLARNAAMQKMSDALFEMKEGYR